MPTAPAPSVNAWIFLGEDEPCTTDPHGTKTCLGYADAGSSYQSLIDYGVYGATDILGICFHDTVPTSATTVPIGDGSQQTIRLQSATHPHGATNEQYLEWVVRDARAANPGIRLLATLGYADDEFTQITDVNAYAANLVAYLEHYGLDGFDIDWEPTFSGSTPPATFAAVVRAIRAAYTAAGKDYLLVISPSTSDNLDASAVNDCVDFLNLQLYGGADPSAFTRLGIAQELLAYGAKFESFYQTAQDAYAGYRRDGYRVITQWRLNSDNYQFEQAQQLLLADLVRGIPTGPFDDADIVGAAGSAPITSLTVRHGDVLDAVQAVNTGSFNGQAPTYTLPQHGGDGGTASTVQLDAGDRLVEVSGFTGDWYGWDVVLQVSFRTAQGRTYGPFGTMSGASSQTPFSVTAPSGQSLLSFSGATVTVPRASGGPTDVVARLDALAG